MLVSYCYNIKDKFCLNFSDSYLKKNKSNGCVKNDMLYSYNAKIINTRLTFSMIHFTDMNQFGTSLEISLEYLYVHLNSK